MEVFVDGFRVDVSRDVRALQQRFQLARKDHAHPIVVVVELLHAERIARQDQPLMPGVPEREPKDAGHVRQHARAVGGQRVQQRFCIGRTLEMSAARAQLRPEALMVVELAVIRQAGGSRARPVRRQKNLRRPGPGAQSTGTFAAPPPDRLFGAYPGSGRFRRYRTSLERRHRGSSDLPVGSRWSGY